MAPVPPPLALELGQDRLVEKELFERARDPDGPRSARSPTSGLPGARQVAAARLRRQGPASSSRSTSELGERRAGRGDRPLRPRAVDHRRARPRRRDRASSRSPRTSTATASCAVSRAPGRRRAAGARPRTSRPAARRARLRRRARARAVRGRRQAARQRVRAAGPQHRPLDDRRRRRRASSRTTCARSSACRSGRPTRFAPAVMLNLIGGAPPRRRSCSRCPARTCTSTARQPRPGRKLGHVTLVGASEETVAEAIALVEGRRTASRLAVAVAGATFDRAAARRALTLRALRLQHPLRLAAGDHRPADCCNGDDRGELWVERHLSAIGRRRPGLKPRLNATRRCRHGPTRRSGRRACGCAAKYVSRRRRSETCV